MKHPRRIWIGVFIAAGLLLLHLFVVRASIVVGRSMTPTLQPWDYCLALRVRHYEPHRGDIITFRDDDEPPLYFIKRVVALPGETIAITHGIVSVNGQVLVEPYTRVNHNWNLPPTLVPPDKIYVLSDNRNEMPEDYVQGLVALHLVRARLLWHLHWKGTDNS